MFQCVGENFCADVIVVQCGCDCLSGDPLGNFNLTEKSLTHCVKTILQANLPTIFLGGGTMNFRIHLNYPVIVSLFPSYLRWIFSDQCGKNMDCINFHYS